MYSSHYVYAHKKGKFVWKDKNLPSSPVIPIDPTTPTTPSTPEQPSTPSTPNQPSVDVDNQTTPRGDANTDTTDISDDTNPRGDAKSGKKVVADKNTEVNVDDAKAPLGTLPRTGGADSSLISLLGAALLGLGVVLRKKIR